MASEPKALPKRQKDLLISDIKEKLKMKYIRNSEPL